MINQGANVNGGEAATGSAAWRKVMWLVLSLLGFRYLLVSVYSAILVFWESIIGLDQFIIASVTWKATAPIIELVMPTPPAPDPPTTKMLAIFWTYIDELTVTFESSYENFRTMHIVTLLVCITPTYYILRWFLRVTRKMIRLTSMKIRGVQLVCSYGEALRAGSTFRTGRPPRGQVAIRIPGIFTTSHNGYGLRLGDVLVCNEHELTGYDEVEICYTDEKGKCSTIALDTTGRMPSPILNDVTYLMLEPKSWAKLGVAKAKARALGDTGRFVTCHGQEGSSSGTVTKTNVLGQIIYTGSTLPGMSGAAYHVDGQVYGMHNGVMGGLNVGFGMEPIVRDIQALFGGPDYQGTTTQQESPSLEERLMTQQEQKRNRGRKNVWTDATLDEQYARLHKPHVMSPDSEDEADEIWAVAAGKKAALNLGESANSLSEVQRRLTGLVSQVKRQSKDGETQEVPLVVIQQKEQDPSEEVAWKFQLMEVIEDLQRRVSELERTKSETKTDDASTKKSRVKLVEPESDSTDASDESSESEGEQQKPKKNKKKKESHPCDKCGVKCTTAKKLQAHTDSAHPVLETHKCPCGVVCRTKARLENHTRECKAVQPESTHLYDNSVKAVKMDKKSFLGEKASNSQKKTAKPSTNNSKSSKPKSRSPSREDVLSAILQSQQNMQKSLQDLVKTMAGRNSAERPN